MPSLTAGFPAMWIALPILLLAAVAGARSGEQVLFDFEGEVDLARLAGRDVTLAVVKRDGGAALRFATGHAQEWPGIDLAPPKGKWDLDRFSHVALDVRNAGSNAVTVCCRVDNPGADGRKNCNTASITLEPGQAGVLTVPFRRKPRDASRSKLFGMRGYPGGATDEPSIHPANVTNLVVFVPRPKADHVFEIDNIRAGGSYTPPPEPTDAKPFFPLIDTFGQFIHKDWPGKVHSLDDLAKNREAEAKDLAAKPGPPSWNQYGGWKDGPQLKATGFFRTEKHGGKWWLVDPEGRLFWSHGVDCVGATDMTPIEERGTWFQDFPGDRPEFRDLLGKCYALHGHYRGRTVQCFSFSMANVRRKYGQDWKRQYHEMAHKRLRSWGLNTIANWSNGEVCLMRKTPYVGTIHFGGKLLEGSSGYWGKFRDVFDPDFRAKLRERMAKEKGRAANDPWCIGFFVDNELSWGDEVSLAVAALASPPGQAAKKTFLADLEAKYKTIEKLNAAWGTQHASWDALLQHRGAPDKKRAWADLTAFYTKTAETYFRTIRECVKEVAPSQLYLGCRFAWVNARAARAAAKYCDVVSYNLYRRSVAGFRFNGDADLPLIIGEFHFGALDRGMFHTGLVPVASQEERAAAYRSYVEGALRDPSFVGTGWFKYTDEPTTGRAYDEENYQIGLLDGCDTPYPETIEAVRQVGYRLYETRLGAK